MGAKRRFGDREGLGGWGRGRPVVEPRACVLEGRGEEELGIRGEDRVKRTGEIRRWEARDWQVWRANLGAGRS